MIGIDVPLWAARLWAWRHGRLWNRQELAGRLFVAAGEEDRERLPRAADLTAAIGAFEAGERRPGPLEGELLCRVFGVQEAELFGQESGEPAGTALWHRLTGVPWLPGRFTPEEEERTGRAIEDPRRADAATVAYLSAVVGECERPDRRPAEPAGALAAMFAVVQRFRGEAGRSARAALPALAARDAEATGRLRYEAGDLAGALRWSERARREAAEAGDELLVACALAGRAGLIWPGSDPREVVETALAAREHAVPSPRLAAVSRLHEALGHAMAGEEDLCHRRLEESAEPPGEEPEETTGFGPGYSPALHQLLAADCLLDLGHPDAAIEILERELGGPGEPGEIGEIGTFPGIGEVPAAGGGRDTAYELARLAHAYAEAHEAERCARAARTALDLARRTGAARALRELRVTRAVTSRVPVSRAAPPGW
ncbi:hypothetical protein Sme01_49740 [Sphaerisporangium melleum]|uniref:HTH cro/C1-type domain-containing protein n=1 Tax=Sphaerisporangium melleum TaxID=321316 RepID=A0A917VK64_9ACTN|nr:hypothetical protein [Sphaerisporangium melleum]GGK89434.1 hypothetical protein GCM10007964_35140 [Sphaerisporangium melleum]GII72498.1 hypothetical protein Sme01_49740 [Sphaerisporangium melleum]